MQQQTTTLNRRTAYTGQHVRITLRSGHTYEGHLAGWGAQIIALRPTDGGKYGWKVESHAVATVARVESATATTSA